VRIRLSRAARNTLAATGRLAVTAKVSTRHRFDVVLVSHRRVVLRAR
jgi:hypothetical protein